MVMSNSCRISEGDRFASFDDLDSQIRNFAASNFCQLWLRDARTIQAASKRTPKRTACMPEQLKYYSLKYCCIHGGKVFKSTGHGQRKSSTFKRGCPFTIDVCLSEDGQHLVIRSINSRHDNHEMSETLFKYLPQQRKLSLEAKQKAVEMLNQYGNKQLVQSALERETGKIVLLRDLKNLMSRSSRSKLSLTRNCYQKFVSALQSKYNADVDIMADVDNCLKGIFFQDADMQNSYEAWPEFMCIDATYKLLDGSMTMFILTCEDSSGNSEIVGVCLLVDEETATFKCFLECFKHRNSEWNRTTMILTDKDFVQKGALSDCFPDARLMTSPFHTLRRFSHEVTTSRLGITVCERKVALDMIKKLMYSTSEDQYMTQYQQFRSSVPQSVTAYFDTNWHQTRGEWCVGLQLAALSFINTTNSSLEEINGQLKEAIVQKCSLEDFLDKLYVVLTSLRKEHDHRTVLQLQKFRRVDFRPNSVEAHYSQLLTQHAADMLLRQLDMHKSIQRLLQPVVSSHESDCFHVDCNDGQVTVTSQSCLCVFSRVVGLPCRHIFAVRAELGLDLFDISLCRSRWLLSSCKMSQRVFANDDDASPCHDSGSVEVSVVSTPTELSTYRKFRLANVETDLLASLAAEVGMHEFEERLNLLKKLKEGWQKGQSMKVVPLSADDASIFEEE